MELDVRAREIVSALLRRRRFGGREPEKAEHGGGYDDAKENGAERVIEGVSFVVIPREVECAADYEEDGDAWGGEEAVRGGLAHGDIVT